VFTPAQYQEQFRQTVRTDVAPSVTLPLRPGQVYPDRLWGGGDTTWAHGEDMFVHNTLLLQPEGNLEELQVLPGRKGTDEQVEDQEGRSFLPMNLFVGKDVFLCKDVVYMIGYRAREQKQGVSDISPALAVFDAYTLEPEYDGKTFPLPGTQQGVLWGGITLGVDENGREGYWLTGSRNVPYGKVGSVAFVPEGYLTDRRKWDIQWDVIPPSVQMGTVMQFVQTESGDLAAVTKYKDILGVGNENEIEIVRASSPAGPFTVDEQRYSLEEPPSDFRTYSVLPHPGLNSGDGLLVSYSIDSFVFGTPIDTINEEYYPHFTSVPILV
jgi:hypothetical protein